ncbi:hypothetical protein B0H63DRAFT_302178 [Podospora didyma]|uniref:Secreted protein n=1 Tax=Podospora didyma TaxID=330526 RepID=A0AAE0N6J5_9PEZI|nr:hypothetical protein B0H63DRAFT_302178 [Podospora didyma]
MHLCLLCILSLQQSQLCRTSPITISETGGKCRTDNVSAGPSPRLPPRHFAWSAPQWSGLEEFQWDHTSTTNTDYRSLPNLPRGEVQWSLHGAWLTIFCIYGGGLGQSFTSSKTRNNCS